MRAKRTSDSKHWRERAGQMRALAITMKDTEAGILMDDLADEYDKIAEKSERQTTKEIKPK
jgi:hypothetical protein